MLSAITCFALITAQGSEPDSNEAQLNGWRTDLATVPCGYGISLAVNWPLALFENIVANLPAWHINNTNEYGQFEG